MERLYLSRHILNDDLGWFSENPKNDTVWGRTELSGDSYGINLNINDLMAEGSTSRVYTFNIFATSSLIYYKRSYKKIWGMITDGIPIVYFVFIVFCQIAKIFKLVELNMKTMGIVFESKSLKNAKKLSLKKNNLVKKNSIQIINMGKSIKVFRNDNSSVDVPFTKYSNVINFVNNNKSHFVPNDKNDSELKSQNIFYS